MYIEIKPFGKLPDGRAVKLFCMTNETGAVAEITNYGGRIVRILVPDQSGALVSVVKGFDALDGYLADTCYLGATCGRFANRISNAKIIVEGEEYTLEANNKEHSLHGGPTGFHAQLWDAAIEGESLILTYISKDGEEGFPGNLKVELAYSWSETNELSLEITATTDKTTPVNITNHTYFNLNGCGDILDHELRLNANRYLPIHADAIPTGEIRFVKDTAFDFSTSKEIGKDIEKEEEQLVNGTGYDHCFVLDKEEFGDLVLAAEVFAPQSGITLRLYTTLPGIQFYSGNFLNSDISGSEGESFKSRQAFCLEPEFFPDSPNQSGFPSCLLKSEEAFQQTLIYQFY